MYCMHSCHRHGLGYPAHNCCSVSYAHVARESKKLMAKLKEQAATRLTKFVAAG